MPNFLVVDAPSLNPTSVSISSSTMRTRSTTYSTRDERAVMAEQQLLCDLMAEQQLLCDLRNSIPRSLSPRSLSPRPIPTRLVLGYMLAILITSYILQRSFNFCHWLAITPFVPWAGSTTQLYNTYCACQKIRSEDTLPDRTLNILNKLAWPISQYSPEWYEESPVRLPSLQFLSNALDPLKPCKIGMDNLTLALGPILSANVKHHRDLTRNAHGFRQSLSRSSDALDTAVKELKDRSCTVPGRASFFGRAKCRIVAVEVLWRVVSLSNVCDRIQKYRQDVAYSIGPIHDLVKQTDTIIDQSLHAIQESLYALSVDHRRRYIESHPRWRNSILFLPTSLLQLTPSDRHDLYVLARLHMWLTLFRFNNVGVQAPLAMEIAFLDRVCSLLSCTQHGNDFTSSESHSSGGLDTGADTSTTSEHSTVYRGSWLGVMLEAST